MRYRRGVVLVVGLLVAWSLLVTARQPDALRQQARAALAQTTGELALAGLEQPVEVIRDRWGVPHIYARTVHDLFFAQGFVAAQDRLWQLDLWRRIAEGKLSELLGPAGLKRDTFARLLRYRGDWDEEWRSYGPNARAIASAFVAGINAQIDGVLRNPAKLPIEFQLTASRPEPWTKEVVVARMAGYIMTRNARTEVQRARLVKRVGVEKAAEQMATDPPATLTVPAGLDLDDITDTILDLTTGTSESVDFAPLRPAAKAPALAFMDGLTTLSGWPRTGAHDARRAVSRDRVCRPEHVWAVRGQDPERIAGCETTLVPDDEPVVGSNDWVVSGALTASKKPILANDPHRALMLPSLRYTVHLNAPGWNVIGAGEPALPGVAAGHNERMAFGFTIVGMDQQDLYVEQLDPANHDRYLYKGQWETLRVERERVKVKGEVDREVELRFTRHGPVLSIDATRHRAYALRWVGSEPGAAGYLRSLVLDTARNMQDFRAAVAGWKIPSENIVYADVDGNIAWIAAGAAPIRKNWNGLLPVPGHTGEYEWDGFLKADDLPQLLNPKSGIIATANHNILPPNYPHQLGYEFGTPYRFARILEGLGGGRTQIVQPDGRILHIRGVVAPTVISSQALQHDVTSIPARAIAEALLMATNDVSRLKQMDPDAPSAARLLGLWDGAVDASSAPAALYEAWSPLLTAAFAQAFGATSEREATTARMTTDRLLDLLEDAGLYRREPSMTAWVDGSPRPVRKRPTADPALRAKASAVLTGPSLADAWRQMVMRQGPDQAKWAWGNVHGMTFEHPLAFTVDRQAILNLPRVPRGGDSTTPNATGAGGRQTAGASYREVIDLSNWDASTTINVPGASGQPESPHYGDLLPLWAEGKYHQMAFSRAAVERVAGERLRLVPGR
jgi:penicillin amidase